MSTINFPVPDQADISLQGSGLTGPESMSLQNGESYEVYSYSDLKAGQTVRISIGGKVAAERKDSTTNNLLAIGIAFLGFASMGAGVWWWRKSANSQDVVEEISSNATTLDGLILEIAKLDEEYEQGKLSIEAHQQLRQNLMRRAKRLL